jgi:hypothetical protein
MEDESFIVMKVLGRKSLFYAMAFHICSITKLAVA